MAKRTFRDFKEEYYNYTPEQKRTMWKLIIIWLILILGPVIAGVIVYLGGPSLWD